MFIKWINDIVGYVHIIVKYSNQDNLNTYGNFCDLVCFTGVSFEGLNFHKRIIELFSPFYWIGLSIF